MSQKARVNTAQRQSSSRQAKATHVLRVDGANEEVLRDVLEMPAVLVPRCSWRDVVGGALALDFDENGRLELVLAVPSAERRDELDPLADRRDG